MVPDSLNQDLDTDPAFQVNPDPDQIRIQGFEDQKLKEKKIQISSKIAIYLCPSYRRSLSNKETSAGNTNFVSFQNFYMNLNLGGDLVERGLGQPVPPLPPPVLDTLEHHHT